MLVPFDPGDIAAGAVYMHTFTVPGSYRYFRTHHESEGMVGAVITSRKIGFLDANVENRPVSVRNQWFYGISVPALGVTLVAAPRRFRSLLDDFKNFDVPLAKLSEQRLSPAT
jgi:hypothetical protein